MYEAMLFDIRRAKKYIFLEYFIIEGGEMWNNILAVLEGKVKEGIEVRVMYDDIGCMRSLPSKYDKTLCEKGIRCVRSGPVSPRMSTAHNNRNHRKILVVDGEIAYTGGVNLADEYINKKKRFGHWKDGGVRVFGDAAIGFLKLFIASWDLSSSKFSDIRAYMPTLPNNLGDGGFYLPFGSGPSPTYSRPVGKNAIMNVINQAQEYVYITTPYLVIDYDLTEALRNAAQRGVDVRIITPKIPDKRLVKVMTKSAYPHLIDAGVSIYEYTPGFIHEKCILSDDVYAIIGTINLDYRSLVHHYENALWIYGSPMVMDAKSGFLRTVESSELMNDKKVKLTLGEWILRNLIRIFAPLL
jgi:cardiolipin synthase